MSGNAAMTLSAILLLGVAATPMPAGRMGVVVVSHACSATEQSLQREVTAVAAGDDEEAAQLFRAAGGVMLKPGWRVRIMSSKAAAIDTRLQLLSGPAAGRTCWLKTADALRAIKSDAVRP